MYIRASLWITKITLCGFATLGPFAVLLLFSFQGSSPNWLASLRCPDGRDELHNLSNLKPAVNIYFLLPALFARASQRLSASLDILTSSASCFTIPACSGPRQSTGYFTCCQERFRKKRACEENHSQARKWDVSALRTTATWAAFFGRGILNTLYCFINQSWKIWFQWVKHCNGLIWWMKGNRNKKNSKKNSNSNT